MSLNCQCTCGSCEVYCGACIYFCGLRDRGLTIWDTVGWETPGCDCGHESMGTKWHASDCEWRKA